MEDIDRGFWPQSSNEKAAPAESRTWCWPPMVMSVWTGGSSWPQRSTTARRNWPPWLKPMTLKPPLSSFMALSSLQTVSTWVVIWRYGSWVVGACELVVFFGGGEGMRTEQSSRRRLPPRTSHLVVHVAHEGAVDVVVLAVARGDRVDEDAWPVGRVGWLVAWLGRLGGCGNEESWVGWVWKRGELGVQTACRFITEPCCVNCIAEPCIRESSTPQ